MTIPAGWYDDGSGNRRWWDGQQWTEHVVAPEQPTAAEAPAEAPAAADAESEPTAASTQETTPFAPPYTMPSDASTTMAGALGQAGGASLHTEGYPATAGAPWAAPSAPQPASGVPVVGIIGLVLVVIGVVGACIPPIRFIGWGILAIGFVTSLVSLFLRGRKWPGIAGLAVAVIGAILAIAVSFVALAATSLPTDDDSPFAVPSERPTDEDGSSTPEGEDPSTIEGAEMVPFGELEVGDCLPLVEYGEEDQIFELPVVPCEQPHTDEIYLIFDVEDGEFPGDDALAEAAWDGCVAQFEDFVGIPYEDSVLDIYTYQPTRGSWTRAEDRTVHCIVFSYEDVTGTLEGAGY